jgi:zinc transport system substrate-binding protein
VLIVIQVSAVAALAEETKPTVFVSILPQKYFVQQICNDLMDVEVMTLPGASPHTYEPKPSQMAALSKAKAYFAIGVPFERTWLDKFAAANPDLKIVHTDKNGEKMPMDVPHRHDEHEEGHGHEGREHEGGEGGEKEHGEKGGEESRDHGDIVLDPHIWLSPPLVLTQSETILEALVAIDPENAETYTANHGKFASKIQSLHEELKKDFAGKEGLRFMVFHPTWGYFAREYGLVQVPAEIEGKEPKPAQLKELIEKARERDIKVVFAQPQFSTRSAELISREIGGRVVLVDPLAPDWDENIRKVAEAIGAELR